MRASVLLLVAGLLAGCATMTPQEKEAADTAAGLLEIGLLLLLR
jgi:hypothetical protein